MPTFLKALSALLFGVAVLVTCFGIYAFSAGEHRDIDAIPIASGISVILISGAVWLLSDITESLRAVRKAREQGLTEGML